MSCRERDRGKRSMTTVHKTCKQVPHTSNDSNENRMQARVPHAQRQRSEAHARSPKGRSPERRDITCSSSFREKMASAATARPERSRYRSARSTPLRGGAPRSARRRARPRPTRPRPRRRLRPMAAVTSDLRQARLMAAPLDGGRSRAAGQAAGRGGPASWPPPPWGRRPRSPRGTWSGRVRRRPEAASPRAQPPRTR
jgi:hypothetical protein